VRVAIIGTGLIGTSVAIAAARLDGAEVTGWDPDAAELAEAASRSGLIAASSLESAVANADLVLIAAPVGIASDVVAAALSVVGENAVVTDVGSTKQAVVEANPDPRFVGGHPLAGGEVGGAGQARGDLFEGAIWFLTPVESTAGVQLERVFRFVSDLGARPRAVAPDVHDRILATVSHLPHVLANLLVSEASGTLKEEGESLPAIGPSFRDATRVAGAPTSIWADIYLSNAAALVERLKSVEESLARVREMLERRDASGISEWNDRAAAMKGQLAAEPASASPARTIQVKVPNRAGVLAEVALALGSSGIGLADLQLLPAADRSTGVIVIGIERDDQVAGAIELISGLGHQVAEVE
jgi:prephenate dehydrogenase